MILGLGVKLPIECSNQIFPDRLKQEIVVETKSMATQNITENFSFRFLI